MMHKMPYQLTAGTVTRARSHTNQEAGSKQCGLQDDGPAHAVEAACWMKFAVCWHCSCSKPAPSTKE